MCTRLRLLSSPFPALFQKVVQGVPNLFKSLALSPINDVADVLAELNVMLGVLKLETF